MSRPNGHFDLDAKRKERDAARSEASREHWHFTFGGLDFALPPQIDWPAATMDKLAEGRLQEVLSAVLDKPEQFWKLDPTFQDVRDLFDAFGQWANVGDDVGESSPSPPLVSIQT